MATLNEILSDPKSLEAIFRGLIGAGTAAAGIRQATTPQITTVVRGAPPSPSALETEALGQGFGILASQAPGMGLTRTDTGLSFQPTQEEQQSVLGLQQALNAMRSRVGGGPFSIAGPADAMINATLTGKPTVDRPGLIGAIRTKMGGQMGSSGTSIDMIRGQDGSFSVPTASGANFNIPSSAVNFPSSNIGTSRTPTTSSGGGFGSVLGIGTGVLGAGAGVLQVLKALGIIGGGGSTDPISGMNPIDMILLARKLGITLPAGVGINTPQTLAANIRDALGMSNNQFGITGDLPDEGGSIQDLLNVFALTHPQIPADVAAGTDITTQPFSSNLLPSITESNVDAGILDIGTTTGNTLGELNIAEPGVSSITPEEGGGLNFDQFGLGNLGSVLGLGTGIANLVGGRGNTASNVIGGIGTAASGLNLVNTFAPTAFSEAVGLTAIAPFLGPIGIVAGIGGLFAKLFGGGPSKHKLQSPQRRAAAASAGLSAAQDAGFDLTQDEANLLSHMMAVGGGPPIEQQSTALNVAHLEALRAKGGKRTQGDIAAIQAILESRGLPTGSVDEIAEAHAIQTIERSGLSVSQQITAINQVKHHFAERKISREKQLAENAAAQERQRISGGLETAFIDSLGREVFKNNSGETSQLVFRDKEGNFVKWRDPDEGEH